MRRRGRSSGCASRSPPPQGHAALPSLAAPRLQGRGLRRKTRPRTRPALALGVRASALARRKRTRG
eukprot:15374356-Alexandrium_andersonii.AAC.1